MEEVKNIDIKGTFEKFIKPDEPEMSQEEAIAKYQEIDISKAIKATSTDGESGENSEEQEHLKRVKKELLASLERVKKLEKQIYGEQELGKEKSRLKVDKGSSHNPVIEKNIEQKDINKGFERD